ncbi:MAG: acyl carrier protein [Psychromonas sp.]|nr:acyl carrier protein [Psychromonas sp.]
MNLKTINDIFAESLDIPLADVTDDLSYQAIAQWDSTAHMVLIGAIENHYDIMMDTDDIIDMSSVAKAKKIIKKYQQ